MGQMTDVSGWVDQLDDTAVHVVDQMLREVGMVQPPTLHFLIDGLDPPYVGYLTCRQFYRGEDAAQAVRAMGLLGSMLGASRVVATWEHADLCTALELPGADEVQTGVVVVDADRAGHVLRWHPAVFRTGSPTATPGGPVAWAEWGQAVTYPRDVELPGPVADLLRAWRADRVWSEGEFLAALHGMEQGGYSMRWVTRPEGEQEQPSWMRLLAAVR